jgi:SAM-dependent methyltransferase
VPVPVSALRRASLAGYVESSGPMLRVKPGDQWERFAQEDPYYGVWAIEDMRGRQLEGEARARFFASGEEHVSGVLVRIRELVDPGFEPTRVLDYGSGVGRVIIPLARGATRAVGVDVSPSMLAEARRNCDALGVGSVELLLPHELDGLAPDFDLVHSALVLQHMPVRDGERTLARLAELLRPGGVGAIQVTIGGTAPLRFFNKLMKLPLAHNVLNVLRRRPWGYPHMQMNVYDLGRLVLLLRDRGVLTVSVQPAERFSGWDSCELIFRRP